MRKLMIERMQYWLNVKGVAGTFRGSRFYKAIDFLEMHFKSYGPDHPAYQIELRRIDELPLDELSDTHFMKFFEIMNMSYMSGRNA